MKRVVCVSRTLGAGGEAIAFRVASELGYRYVDDEIVARAAEVAGVSREEMEQAEHSQSLVTRILEALAATPPVSEGGFVAPVAPSKGNYSHVIEHVIRETAENGDVVIVAHGGSHALRNRGDALRVFITASPDVRQGRLTRDGGMEAGAAKKAVEASDKERARYLQRNYNIGEEQAIHYDLTVNTDNIEDDVAAGLVLGAARA
jgi:cytidylate kinase